MSIISLDFGRYASEPDVMKETGTTTNERCGERSSRPNKGIRMFNRTISRTTAAMAFLPLCPAAIAAQPPERLGAWTIEQSVTPLTSAISISAVLDSAQPLTNMIGQPQNAALVLRCQDHVFVTYVSWPEVVNVDLTTFGGRPQTMVLWRMDQQPIAVNFWLRDTSGTAAGMFDTKAASKLIGKIWGTKQLVVRMTGRAAQDAVFDLGDIRAVAARVGAPCGVSWTPNK